MTLPTAAALAASIKATWALNDPAGFGALTASEQNAIRDLLLEAVATEVLAAVVAATVTVTGTTASACTAGGSAGTCSGSAVIS